MRELIYHRTFLPAIDRWATKIGFHDGDHHATFEQHGDRVLRLADAMHTELGLERGDRFAVMAANSHQYLELYHAGFLGAGIVNPLNLRLAGKELQFILADSETEVVFVDAIFADHFARNIAEVRDELPLRHVVLIGDADAPHDVRYEDLIATGRAVDAGRAGRGRPGRAHVHRRHDRLAQGGAARPTRRAAEPVPHRHDGRLPRPARLPASDADVPRGVDGRRARHPGDRRPVDVRAALRSRTGDGRHRAVPGRLDGRWSRRWSRCCSTTPTSVPSAWHRSATSSTARRRCRPALLDRVQSLLPGTNLWQGYGMTECSSVLTFLTDEDHRTRRTAPAFGRPPHDGRRYHHPRQGRPTGRTRPRRRDLRARRQLHAGVLAPPRRDETCVRGGWYHTGDEGHLDADGYVYLVDRVKDMIVTGGENVYSDRGRERHLHRTRRSTKSP